MSAKNTELNQVNGGEGMYCFADTLYKNVILLPKFQDFLLKFRIFYLVADFFELIQFFYLLEKYEIK